MNKLRIIARIDVKNNFAIKGIQLEGLRKIGDPNELALNYYNQCIDEIIFMDAVAAYYDRNSLTEIIEKACNDIFVPITVGGGIRNLQDIDSLLKVGADKVAINTQAVRNPEFIKKASKVYGSQCIVSSIDAKKQTDLKWEVYIENGREPTGIDVFDWIKEVEKLGSGEILLTSIDKDGTRKGFDLCLIEEVSKKVSIPIIYCGGAGSIDDIEKLLNIKNIDAISISSLLHYNLLNILNLKKVLSKNGKIKLRKWQ